MTRNLHDAPRHTNPFQTRAILALVTTADKIKKKCHVAGCGQFNPDSAVPGNAMSKEQTFPSGRSLSLRLIRLRRKWVSALRKFTGSTCSNGSKRFERRGSDFTRVVFERSDN
jgi:hypothetical protein